MSHRTTLIEFITLLAKNIATFQIQGRTKVLEFSLTSSVCNVLLVINLRRIYDVSIDVGMQFCLKSLCSADRFRVRKTRRIKDVGFHELSPYRISSEIQPVDAAARDGPEVSVTALQGSFQGRL